jgi:hypothetical protein
MKWLTWSGRTKGLQQTFVGPNCVVPTGSHNTSLFNGSTFSGSLTYERTARKAFGCIFVHLMADTLVIGPRALARNGSTHAIDFMRRIVKCYRLPLSRGNAIVKRLEMIKKSWKLSYLWNGESVVGWCAPQEDIAGLCNLCLMPATTIIQDLSNSEDYIAATLCEGSLRARTNRWFRHQFWWRHTRPMGTGDIKPSNSKEGFLCPRHTCQRQQ